jgi:hypothetical protein
MAGMFEELKNSNKAANPSLTWPEGFAAPARRLSVGKKMMRKICRRKFLAKSFLVIYMLKTIYSKTRDVFLR